MDGRLRCLLSCKLFCLFPFAASAAFENRRYPDGEESISLTLVPGGGAPRQWDHRHDEQQRPPTCVWQMQFPKQDRVQIELADVHEQRRLSHFSQLIDK